jgi:hypothetical protein
LKTVLSKAKVPEDVRTKCPWHLRLLLSRIRLLHARATPLNQDNQHDDKKHAGNNPDDRGLIHFDSLPSFKWLRTLLSEKRFE